MTKKLIFLAMLAATTLMAQQSRITPLMQKDLTGIPGKEGVMLTVDYKPGQTEMMHRHNAHVFVYVLRGSLIMQVKGKPLQTLHVGDTFYESPEDIHVVGKNASKTEPAKFLVFFVKDKDTPSLVSVK